MPKSGIIRVGRLLDLDAVAAVARHRNFRRAAIELGLSTTALSRIVAALEERLGIQLFLRTTRSVSLTAAGERFVARIGPALDQIGEAVDEVNDQRTALSGTLRINCSSGAAHYLLQPILLPFLSRYPAITVEVGTEDRLIDIVAHGYDAGIRQAMSIPAGMVSVPISGPMRFVIVGSPEYLSGRVLPRVPDDLASHNCIRIRLAGGELYRWEFRKNGAMQSLDVPGTLMLQDPSLMRLAALAGAGLAYVAEWRVEDDLASGRLVSLLRDWTPDEDGMCLYHPSRRHPTAALRALIDAIEAAS